jgi:hypothetical protein
LFADNPPGTALNDDKTSFLPHSGIRFPNNGCVTCPFVGICLCDQDLVSSKLVQVRGGERGLNWGQNDYGWSLWDAETPVARRVIAVDNDSVVCFEYNRPYYRHPSGIAVECSGPRGLHASLTGEMGHIAEVYRTIGEITVEGK